MSNVGYQTVAGGNPDVAAGRVSTLISSKIDPATRAPDVEVEELYLDAMFAVPSVTVPPPTSLQVPYQAVTVYTRTLTPELREEEQDSDAPTEMYS